MKWPVIFLILCLTTLSEQAASHGGRPFYGRSYRKYEDTSNTVQTTETSAPDVVCLAGSVWESNCYKCKCSDGGQAKCTRIESCDGQGTPRSCKPFTTFRRGCNVCTCKGDGQLFCMPYNCEQADIQTTSLLPGKDCAPGSQWKSQCNSCNCSVDGVPICTDKACPGQENEAQYLCAPKSVWQNDCNNCWCTEEGVPSCTRMNCKGIDASDFNPKRKKEQTTDDTLNFMPRIGVPTNMKAVVCAANKMFVKDCNACWCSEDGTSYVCTRRVCADNVEDSGSTKPEKVDSAKVSRRCRPHDVVEHGCHSCICNAEGVRFLCSRSACSENITNQTQEKHDRKVREAPQMPASLVPDDKTKAVVCPANKMFVKDCNMCWCNEDGTSYICTRKVCVDGADYDRGLDNLKHTERGRKVRATPQEMPKNCQPGQEFRMDCNKCLCDNEGQNYSCTRIDCAALSNNNGGTRSKREISSQIKKECTPGGVFEQHCNVCRCSEDGAHATCTLRRRCKVDKVDEEGDDQDFENGFRCNPGEQFKQDCNDCACSADGKDIFCTLRFCEQSITDI